MFKNVLVGVDGSANSRDAIALASRLMEAGASLTLAHVDPRELRPSHAITPGLVAEDRERSEKLLEDERAAAKVQADVVNVVASSPGRGLHQQAEHQGADLIVVGSCRRGGLGRAMLGDDARAALNGAPCAVAIAARGYAAASHPMARVGVAFNESDEAKDALAQAQELAARSGARVHVLEVVSIPTAAFTGLVPPAIGETMDVMLEEATERMNALGGVEGHAVYGLPGEELAAFGDQLDILVVGSRGYGPLKRLVLGSTSEYLERHARCSLLVLTRAAAG